MYQCECGRSFDNVQSFRGHKAHCIQHHIAKYGNSNMLHEKDALRAQKAREAKSCKLQNKKDDDLAQWVNEQHACEKCGKIMETKYGSGRFCSRSCANSRVATDEIKKKISLGVNATKPNYIKKFQQDYLKHPNVCKSCGKALPYDKRTNVTCGSKECLSNMLSRAGQKSADARQSRSKNEMYFCELCEKHFNCVLHNIPMFNGWDADVIIEDVKIAVLWNGPWHYLTVMPNQKSSLLQIQNRDKIKIVEIQRCGYTPYVIKDMGKFNKDFVEAEFQKFLQYISQGGAVGSSSGSW